MLTLPKHLSVHLTNDGSPTLVLTRGDGYLEKMHHSGGALSESLYIYHSALELLLEQKWPVRLISFGLGLGYNELLSIAELVKRKTEDYKIWSFESDEFLKSSFLAWSQGEGASSELAKVYGQILNLIARHFDLLPEKIVSELRQAVSSGRLELRHAFPDDLGLVKNASLVFYDAFSNKMDAEPWLESTLIHQLGRLLNDQCILTTYAATGNLNRALKELGFSLRPRPGFQGKRQSTLAIRTAFR